MEYTVEQLEAIIHTSLVERDFRATEAALRVLAIVDPRRAELILSTIQLGIHVARTRLEKEGR